MRPQLLCVAVAVATIVFPAAPALAGSPSHGPAIGSAPRFSGIQQGGIPVRIHRGSGNSHDGDHRRRHRRDHDDTIIAGDGWGYYGGEWALYNNRSWESDSYNDWWHDQPWRAYPRWMSQNLGCDRRWYSGDVLRC